MKLSNKTYDVLKWIAQTALPAMEAFWLAFAGIWVVPYAIPIGATIAAIDVLLGTLLGIESIRYRKESKPPDQQ
jgi:hypothetical protein